MTAASSASSHKDTAAVFSSALSLHDRSFSSPALEQQSSTTPPLSMLLHATVSTSQDSTASEQDTAAASLASAAVTESSFKIIPEKDTCPQWKQTIYKKNMVKHN